MLNRIAMFGLFGLLVLSGCESCQQTKQPPPAAAPPAAAPPAAAPQAADTEDEIDEDALVLLAEGEPDYGPAPLQVKFSVESLLTEEMNEPKYTWDFGDESPVSNEASPTHVYEKVGSYTATIRIADKEGLLGWDEIDVEVE